MDVTVKDVVRAAAAAYQDAPASWAHACLKDEASPLAALFIAARRLLGTGLLDFEPETLWASLPGLAVFNRDKLLAAITLAVHPAFFWDPRVLAATTLACNDEAVFANTLPRTTPEQLAWAVLEAELVFSLADQTGTEPEFDDEATAYVAAMLFDAGLTIAPLGLEFAQEQLRARLSPQGTDLATRLQALHHSPASRSKLQDPALRVQLDHLERVALYVKHRLAQLRRALP